MTMARITSSLLLSNRSTIWAHVGTTAAGFDRLSQRSEDRVDRRLQYLRIGIRLSDDHQALTGRDKGFGIGVRTNVGRDLAVPTRIAQRAPKPLFEPGVV